MKNILFIVNNGKISPNENGGASVYFSHLEMLSMAGYKITVLAVQWGDHDVYQKKNYTEIISMVSLIIPCKVNIKLPSKGLKRLYQAICKPEVFEYYFLNKMNTTYLHSVVLENNINYVWAEWRWAGLWSWYSKLKIPVIYAHHDWEYKLAKLRKKNNFFEKFHTYQKKRIEFKMVKEVAGCVSGSNTEKLEIEAISKRKALYIPTTYKNELKQLKPKNTPDIIHLGGMGTTANRLGLERFIDISWDTIKRRNEIINLVVIGSLKQAQPSLIQKIKNDPRIISLGFVENLSEILYPNDIHIIPWEYNTGTRTRLPLILNYSQVLVATKQSVKAFPELVHEKNAILCDNLKQMSNEICILSNDLIRLKHIGENAKKTFLNHFTSRQNFHKINEYLKTI